MISLSPIQEEDFRRILNAPLPWHHLFCSKILVTGAAGFIGGQIVETLAFLNRRSPNPKISLFALARDRNKLYERLPWIKFDQGEVNSIIQDTSKPIESTESFDIIIHTASPATPAIYMQEPVDTILANTEGTRHILESGKRNGTRVLFLSSGAVYGEKIGGVNSINETDFGTDDPLGPRACYSESKRLAETLCRAYFTQYGVDARIARISHCYGPGMRLNDGRAMNDILSAVINGKDIHLGSNGLATRPYCYISDTILGLFHILLKGKAGEAYNVGSTYEVSILELAQELIKLANKKDQIIIYTKNDSVIAEAARRSGHFDIRKIMQLGWHPQVELSAGLYRLFAHYTHTPRRSGND
jgi:UDP-glucuronate decarboxylase